MKSQNDIFLKDLISLLGPNTRIRLIDSCTGEDQYSGIAIKLFRDLPDMDGTIVKHISPAGELDSEGRFIFRIYTY